MRFTQVIGIASGKGGVGKTTVAVNLAVALRRLGHSVWLLDADLGLANAQLALGCAAGLDLSHVLRGQAGLLDILIDTPSGVRLLPGPSGDPEMAGLSPSQAFALVQAFSALQRNPDFLIVDLPAGISPATMALLGATQDPMVVVADTPASVAAAYATLKLLWRDHRPERVTLLPNLVASREAGRELFERINAVCLRELDRHLHFLTSIEQDESLLRSALALKPVHELEPDGSGARAFDRLATALLRRPAVRADAALMGFFADAGEPHAEAALH